MKSQNSPIPLAAAIFILVATTFLAFEWFDNLPVTPKIALAFAAFVAVWAGLRAGRMRSAERKLVITKSSVPDASAETIRSGSKAGAASA